MLRVRPIRRKKSTSSTPRLFSKLPTDVTTTTTTTTTSAS